jgi:hypothetical protein
MNNEINSSLQGKAVLPGKPVVWPKWKIRLFFGSIIVVLVAWFGLGIYLHQQVVQSRTKVEQARIEQNRRQEFLRRDAQYKQDLQRRTQAPQSRNVFEGR